jgi:antitoxin VapB
MVGGGALAVLLFLHYEKLCLNSLAMALNILNPEASRLAAEVAALKSRLDQIALRCAARPMHDQRTAEQILGYDGHGLP